jgi:hypothetical protein
MSELQYIDGRLIRPHALTDAERETWARAAAEGNEDALLALMSVSRLRDERDTALSHNVVLTRHAKLLHDRRGCWCHAVHGKATCAEGSMIRAAVDLLTGHGLADRL